MEAFRGRHRYRAAVPSQATASLLNECRLDLVAAVDSLRIELEVLKSYLERYPDFSKSYPRLRQEALCRPSIPSG
jgi:hypothetical protein